MPVMAALSQHQVGPTSDYIPWSMAVAQQGGFIDTNCHPSRRSTARARDSCASQTAMRDDVSPPSRSSSSRTRVQENRDARVHSTTTMDDASEPDRNQQDPSRCGRPGQDASTQSRRNTSHLVHQMQQLQLPLRTQAFNEYVSLLPPPQRPTQTVSHVDESLRGYDRLITLGASDTPAKALPSFGQWPTVSATTSHHPMSFPRRSQQLPILNNNHQARQAQQPPPRIAQPAADYGGGFTRLERDSRAIAEEKFDALMDGDDEDVLLDDDSLDMLVSTLARETARIEAARTSYASAFRSNNASARARAGEDDDDYDDGEGGEGGDNQRHVMECDGDSSDASSHPSTPTTSTSDTSGAAHTGKSKLKPKRVRRACVVPGCGKRSRSLGLCIAHGGGRRCVVEGCDKSSQGGNHCIKHGGGKRCSVDGCDKAAQTNSLCKAHGGGPRCQFEDCEKSSQGGGYCRQHGGGKRCAFAGCMKGTQRGSYCALHGGSRLCIVEGCRRNDRGGGYCAHHGGGKRCTIDGCARPSRRNGLCSTHLRLLDKDEHSLEDLNHSIDQGIRRTLASAALSSPSHSPLP